MTDGDSRRALAGIRREPPPFRNVEVRHIEALTAHMAYVTFGGPQLEGLRIDEPAASVRLLLPSAGAETLVLPEWNGNEFLMADGARPLIRTFTPLPVEGEPHQLALRVVLHDGGAVSSWARSAQPGDRAAISGPGRGYTVDPAATAFLLGGDETAIPAIGQLIGAAPAATSVHAIIEIAHPDARLDLPHHPRAQAAWLVLPPDARPGASLVDGIRGADIPPGAKVWVAGEAAAMHRIRRHLFDDRNLSRNDVTVRGYWKHGR